MAKIKETNNGIIGLVDSVIKYLKQEMINQIKEIDLFNKDIDCDDIENKQDNLNLLMDLLNGMYQDIITGYLKKKDKIRVYYNDMGAYWYEEISDEESED